MRKIIIFLIIVWPAVAYSQVSTQISLKHCLEKTAHNYPLSDQNALISAISDLNQQIIRSGFLPQLALNGQISYQSDVTSLPITLPNVSISQLSKDWYKLNVDVSQLIYDGGALKMQQSISASDAEIEQQDVAIELYKVRQIVQNTFFNILLLNENKKTIILLKNELAEKLKSIESGIKNGLILPANRDNLKAELIKIDQNVFELELGIESAIENLNILTGLQLTKKNTFLTPETSTSLGLENNRPELNLFDAQISKIDLIKEMTALKRRPKVLGFGQAGYGRPGLNMLSNDFEPYFVVGAKLSWKISDWGNANKEKQILGIQIQKINNRRETFNHQLELLLTQKRNEIKRLGNYIKNDKEIVVLKGKVARAASSQFENGQITATEFLLEKNAETKARLNLQLHQLQLKHAILEYKYTLGNLNFD